MLRDKSRERAGDSADFRKGGFFSFKGNGDLSEIGERREELGLTFFYQVLIEAEIIGRFCKVYNRRVGFIGLNDDRGGF